MCDDVSKALDRAPVRGVLPERNTRTRPIIIDGEIRKNPPKMLFVEYDQMIGTLAPDRPDRAFNMAVLPRRATADSALATIRLSVVRGALMIARSGQDGVRPGHSCDHRNALGLFLFCPPQLAGAQRRFLVLAATPPGERDSPKHPSGCSEAEPGGDIDHDRRTVG
jgi:hypothetical protein